MKRITVFYDREDYGMAEQVMEKKKDIASKLNSVAEGFLQLAGEEFADDFIYFSE